MCGAHAATAAGCAACGSADAIGVRPLVLLTGASGVGKTSITAPLQVILPEANVFDSDALLGLGKDLEWESRLHVAHAGAQVGRATVLCGTVLPEWLEDLSARETVGPLHVGLLHCSDEVRAARLLARPAWRQSSSLDFVQAHADFAEVLRERGWRMFDTTSAALDVVAAEIAAWIRELGAAE